MNDERPPERAPIGAILRSLTLEAECLDPSTTATSVPRSTVISLLPRARDHVPGDLYGGTLGPITGFALVWSNKLPANGGRITRLAIPPGVARHVDLLLLHRPSVPDGGGGSVPVSDEGEHEAVASLEIYPRPRTGTQFFGAGGYTIVVAVTARDTDAAFYSIDVTFDGLWWGADKIREHLKVGEPVPTRERAF
jgi:hypothetical protein